MSIKQGPFIFIATVIVSCLVISVYAVVYTTRVPSLVVSVFLSCAVASLLYGIIGGVSEAGFDFGPLKVGGSAAVLLGSVWLFDRLLEPQLEAIRQGEYSFVFADHVQPGGVTWFAVDAINGEPMDVSFLDPFSRTVAKTVSKPATANLPLRLNRDGDNDRFLVIGDGARQGLGYLSEHDVLSAAGGGRGTRPGKVYGFKRLHLSRGDTLPANKPRSWGSNGPCLGTRLPFQLRVLRFDEGYATFDVTVCGAGEAGASKRPSSLQSGEGEIIQVMVKDQERDFLIAVVAANHQETPPWSTFLVIEMEQEPIG